MVTPEEAQRLALIRYQLTLALQQAEKPPPINGLSVLGFQDALESFLYLAAEHLHAAVTKKMEFDKLIDAVSDKMPDGQPLRYRGPLLALNNARVDLKHYGNLLDRRTVERHRLSTLAFLEEETPRVFGITFEGISLASFIRDTAARGLVEDGERARRDGDGRQAMVALRLAFDRLIKDYKERKVRYLGALCSPSGRHSTSPTPRMRASLASRGSWSGSKRLTIVWCCCRLGWIFGATVSSS